jgi:hypothetical protein
MDGMNSRQAGFSQGFCCKLLQGVSAWIRREDERKEKTIFVAPADLGSRFPAL